MLNANNPNADLKNSIDSPESLPIPKLKNENNDRDEKIKIISNLSPSEVQESDSLKKNNIFYQDDYQSRFDSRLTLSQYQTNMP